MTELTEKEVREEFKQILKMLDFNKRSHELFKRWYVDGRLYFHKVVDTKNTKDGIQKLRIIDPRSIKYVREVEKDEANVSEDNIAHIKRVREDFLYTEGSVIGNIAQIKKAASVALTKDSVTYVPSGLTDLNNNIVKF